ncbi:hypothetical protein EVAR_36967_1 [Eumeta japonica]|uniref:Uncharacterized protein n=1 Tax=Eumeta variegata TaxID=151549 RepID=A0A4C1W9F4_EUMVA|nr:hypothetical protein EVAR_36967_1 [Eumeta japonica]
MYARRSRYVRVCKTGHSEKIASAYPFVSRRPTHVTTTRALTYARRGAAVHLYWRFTKITPEGIVPLQTVRLTFLSNILPDHINYGLCIIPVEECISDRACNAVRFVHLGTGDREARRAKDARRCPAQRRSLGVPGSPYSVPAFSRGYSLTTLE